MQHILIYPNPVQDYILIKSEKEITQVSVYDLNGQRMQQLVFNKNKCDVSHLPQGNYRLQVTFIDHGIHCQFISKQP